MGEGEKHDPREVKRNDLTTDDVGLSWSRIGEEVKMTMKKDGTVLNGILKDYRKEKHQRYTNAFTDIETWEVQVGNDVYIITGAEDYTSEDAR